MKKLKICGAIFITLFLVLNSVVPAGASITPDYLEATLAPGKSVTETKTVHIEEVPPLADVVFAFDLTSSMMDVLNSAKENAVTIMNTLNTIPGVDINYGVMSYMDYPNRYTSCCGYSARYGSPIDGCADYAYRLDQSVTKDIVAVSNAIKSLIMGCGADGPEDYTRIMYESYADPAVSWRAGAKRILVNFADSVPHDCNLNEGVTSGNWTTGGDPGRDEIMGTADDLDLQTVLADLDAHGVTLLECHTTTDNDYDLYWTYWTGITGGGLYTTDSSTLVDDVVTAVNATMRAPVAKGVHLEASPGYEAWVSTNPALYDEVVRCTENVDFEVTISVPEGTPEGTYMFAISVMDEDGVNYGDQTVVITVPPVNTVPPRSPEELGSRTLGFYKNHPCIVDRLLPQNVGQHNFTTVDEVMELLWSQPRGDHNLILERAVLVTKLNVEMFGIGDSDLLGIGESVNEIIAQGEEMLVNSEATKDELSAQCELLDQINNYDTDVPLPEDITDECLPSGG